MSLASKIRKTVLFVGGVEFTASLMATRIGANDRERENMSGTLSGMVAAEELVCTKLGQKGGTYVRASKCKDVVFRQHSNEELGMPERNVWAR